MVFIYVKWYGDCMSFFWVFWFFFIIIIIILYDRFNDLIFYFIIIEILKSLICILNDLNIDD